jgi:hypothetical protein
VQLVVGDAQRLLLAEAGVRPKPLEEREPQILTQRLLDDV